MEVTRFLFLACFVTVRSVSMETDEEFKSMVLDELKELKTHYTKLESENKQLRKMISTRHVYERQLGYIPESEVAFSAKVSQHVKNLTAHQTIVFGNVLSNIGGFYNSGSGVFHTPVAGTYLLFVNILSESGNAIETELIADGNPLAEIYSGGNHFFGAGSNLVIAHLEKGTDVWVKVHGHYSTDMSVHCCWSTFSGYLLRESDSGLHIVG